jgi:hypothetical protein
LFRIKKPVRSEKAPFSRAHDNGEAKDQDSRKKYEWTDVETSLTGLNSGDVGYKVAMNEVEGRPLGVSAGLEGEAEFLAFGLTQEGKLTPEVRYSRSFDSRPTSFRRKSNSTDRIPKYVRTSSWTACKGVLLSQGPFPLNSNEAADFW